MNNLLRCWLCAMFLIWNAPNSTAMTHSAADVGGQSTLWQIGKFDHSSGEFHSSYGVDYASPSSDVVFTVGKSRDKDWFRFQPGRRTQSLADAFIHLALTSYCRGHSAGRICCGSQSCMRRRDFPLCKSTSTAIQAIFISIPGSITLRATGKARLSRRLRTRKKRSTFPHAGFAPAKMF